MLLPHRTRKAAPRTHSRPGRHVRRHVDRRAPHCRRGGRHPATDLLKVYPGRGQTPGRRLHVQLNYLLDVLVSVIGRPAGLVYLEHEGNVYESQEEEDRVAKLVSDFFATIFSGSSCSTKWKSELGVCSAYVRHLAPANAVRVGDNSAATA